MEEKKNVWKRINLDLSESVHNKLTAISESQGRSIVDLLREGAVNIIEKYYVEVPKDNNMICD